MSTEKTKNRLELTSEELERVLLHKEGESLKDGGLQGRSPGGKRVIGKAVAKGGLLLKGKNPGNVCIRIPAESFQRFKLSLDRFRDRRTTLDRECRRLLMHIERP